ncbi:MAG: hypothetical protein AVDCRST_MAG88-2231, partial [uncultured Thermomicrobiales bacterium]
MVSPAGTPPHTEKGLRGGALRFPTLAAAARRAEPVTLAMPLAQGVLHDPGDFRLLDGGTPLPVQARATSHWPDGSVRWLFARAQVDLPAGAAKDVAWTVAGTAQDLQAHEAPAALATPG